MTGARENETRNEAKRVGRGGGVREGGGEGVREQTIQFLCSPQKQQQDQRARRKRCYYGDEMQVKKKKRKKKRTRCKLLLLLDDSDMITNGIGSTYLYIRVLIQQQQRKELKSFSFPRQYRHQ